MITCRLSYIVLRVFVQGARLERERLFVPTCKPYPCVWARASFYTYTIPRAGALAALGMAGSTLWYMYQSVNALEKSSDTVTTFLM